MRQSLFLTNAIAVPLGALTVMIALCLASMAGRTTVTTPGSLTPPLSPTPSTDSGNLYDAEGG
ncbi:MAG: hypothetical protein ACP5JJ_18930, partial [Anaerolineae bacterium]